MFGLNWAEALGLLSALAVVSWLIRRAFRRWRHSWQGARTGGPQTGERIDSPHVTTGLRPSLIMHASRYVAIAASAALGI